MKLQSMEVEEVKPVDSVMEDIVPGSFNESSCTPPAINVILNYQHLELFLKKYRLLTIFPNQLFFIRYPQKQIIFAFANYIN